MAHMIRTVTSSAILVINRSSYGSLRTILPVHARTVFSNAGIGLDNFKLAREQHVSRHASSIDGFKKRFLDSINQTDSEIFTEDLRNMIMVADNSEEINGVIQALKKYNKNKFKFTDYHFGSPIMRLLYIQNKPDLAIEVFMDENLKDIFHDSGSALILLNKLIEDKRYDDAIKIFEYGSQRGFSTSSGRTFPTDVVMLAIEALYRQNTKQSLAKAKELITNVTKHDTNINPRTASMIALLAIQQKEASFAMEILGAVRTQNLTTVQNIRAICYAEMGRVEEAINVVHLLADQPPIDNDRRRVFPLVLQHIQKAVEKSNDENLKRRFEDLSKFVSENNRLSTTDLPDFVNEPITRRGAIVHNRQGAQQVPSGGFQRNFRDSGFRGQQYNRDNRGDNYERRSQNTFNENRSQPSFRQENPTEQLNQSPPSRFKRIDNPSSLRSREQNVSRQSGTKVRPMETTSTSPIPQRSTQSGRTNDENISSSRSNWKSDKNEEKSSAAGKRDERQTGGNTGVQEQTPWSQNDGKLS